VQRHNNKLPLLLASRPAFFRQWRADNKDPQGAHLGRPFGLGVHCKDAPKQAGSVQEFGQTDKMTNHTRQGRSIACLFVWRATRLLGGAKLGPTWSKVALRLP